MQQQLRFIQIPRFHALDIFHPRRIYLYAIVPIPHVSAPGPAPERGQTLL